MAPQVADRRDAFSLLGEFREANKRLAAEYKVLLDEYPDKWVAMSKDGVVATGDSIEEVRVAFAEAGYDKNQLAVEFLDTEPRVMIL